MAQEQRALKSRLPNMSKERVHISFKSMDDGAKAYGLLLRNGYTINHQTEPQGSFVVPRSAVDLLKRNSLNYEELKMIERDKQDGPGTKSVEEQIAKYVERSEVILGRKLTEAEIQKYSELGKFFFAGDPSEEEIKNKLVEMIGKDQLLNR